MSLAPPITVPLNTTFTNGKGSRVIASTIFPLTTVDCEKIEKEENNKTKSNVVCKKKYLNLFFNQLCII